MRLAKTALLGLAGVCLGTTVELRAQIPTDRTYLEFTTPARIPGATLAPGMYLFVIGRPVGGQSIIDIFSSDGSRHVATCLAIEGTLPRPALSTTTDYPGAPSALRAWHHPSNALGLEFVYSAVEAKELFDATHLPVPYAAFKATNRDLVGAFPIRRMPPAGVTSAPEASTGTSGINEIVEVPDESLGAQQHLTNARRVIAVRAMAAPRHEQVLLEAMGKQVTRLQAAFRQNNRKDTLAALSVIDASILNLMPNEIDIAQHRQQRLSRETVVVLERVQAHVRAAVDARSLRSPNLP